MSIQDILTSINNDTVRVQAEKAKTRTSNSEMDQDAFLQLLMTQLKTQDPLNPVDTKDFMSQEAQLTQVSELQKLNKTISNSNQMVQASSLIGKEVTLTDPDNSSNTLTGTVTEAVISSSGAGVVIDGTAYSLDLITNIK